MSSSLSLLRNFTIGKNDITLLNDKGEPTNVMSDCSSIQFGDQGTFSRFTNTELKKTATDGQSDTYALDTLVFLLQHASSDNSAYFRECREQRVDHVSIVDKRKILDYLTGKVKDVPNIVTAKRPLDDDATMSETDAIKRLKIAQDTKERVDRIIKREHELESRSSVLQGTKSFEKLSELVKSLLFSKSSNRLGKQQQAAQPISSRHHNKFSSEDKIPIIIVPAAPTAKLNLFNIKEFLQNEMYLDAQEIRASGEKKPDQVTVERRRPNGQIAVYHIVDSVSGLKQTDWDRVCCVVTTGQQWQFKGWKWEKPLDVFSHVQGFYPKWSSDKVIGTAADWAVHVLNIHRDRRYMDKAAVVDFWNKLDAFNSKCKPFLNF
ncbi:CDC73-domain-containing protein [Hesseltinella vesiculosa]|uniref:CDC73-domain-containing protein n=1 Tax=Hesseltinella vesiculosa TaxID=101127 RepID=A0A1X2G392_9FUNG|nr:CDC73-domain-containing protein [Hesseltinella vesiculosa]